MPTAKSAVQSQSSPRPSPDHQTRRPRRLLQAGLGILIAVAVLVPMQTISAPAAAAGARPSCPGWTSTTRPPDYIRVLRRHSGQVDRVPFKTYVITVLGKEWPSYLPQAVIDAGAVAVKQYGWFHAMGNGRVSRSGQCYDVTDGVGDQLYKPGKSRIRQDHYTAVAATWGVRLLKNGSLFMTGYRTGSKGVCGHDATGWKLFARSATRCADRGDSFLTILRIYYGPVAVVSSSAANIAADGSSSLTVNIDVPTQTITFTVPNGVEPVSSAVDPASTAIEPAPSAVETAPTAVEPMPIAPDFVLERAFSNA